MCEDKSACHPFYSETEGDNARNNVKSNISANYFIVELIISVDSIYAKCLNFSVKTQSIPFIIGVLGIEVN